MEFLEESGVGIDLFQGSRFPQHDFFNDLELVEMSILIVGEMFAMFPSLKASGARIGFLNQSTFPWMKSLVSTENWSNCDTSSSGRKKE